MMERTSRFVATLVVMVGCSGEDFSPPQSTPPAQFGGEYSVQLVNGTNGCAFKDWKEGAVSPSISLTIEQSGDQLTVNVGQELAGLYLNLLLGSSLLKGQVTGESFKLVSLGDRRDQKTCQLRWELTVTGQTTTQGFDGKLVYRPQFIVQNQDCEAPVGCTTEQTMAALRR